MRTLSVRFFAAEDGSPIEGHASLLAGRWRTPVEPKHTSARTAHEVRFEVDDTTVVNEVLVGASRRFSKYIAWRATDQVEVHLERTGEMVIAANHDAKRLILVRPTAGQDGHDLLRSMGKGPHVLQSGQAIHCMRLLPGPYEIDVLDDARRPIAQLTVDVPAWRTLLVEVP